MDRETESPSADLKHKLPGFFSCPTHKIIKASAYILPGPFPFNRGKQGPDYHLEDTFGIAGANAGTFHKVSVAMTYRGVVIKDGKELTSQQINSPNWRDFCVAADEWVYDKKEFF